MSTHAGLPGFRDFYPADLAVRTHIMNAWREAARRHAFEEYDGPPLEPLELYTEKSGDEIVGQLYTFTDKGGRAVALRPEMTPTLARMVGARAGGLRKPVRWFTMPQLFRYERTQRGRLREHFQWNVDIIGESDVGADAEVLATGLDALALLGLDATAVVARFNDRRLLERLLLHTGVAPLQLAGTYAAIDKLTREPAERIRERLEKAGLDRPLATSVLAIFDNRDLDGLRRRFASVDGVADELARLDDYSARLADLGHGDTVTFDPTIVRGLAYYTGIVFEIFDRAGQLRAICGGGRYDRLLDALGGANLPAVGFGMGDVVLAELLAERGLLTDWKPSVDYFIVTVGDEPRPLRLRIATRLRAAGHSVAYALRDQSVKQQFKEAGARGARRTLVLGPDEVAAGVAVVRDMAAGEEKRVGLEELLGVHDWGTDG
jgi:histidyl-tRNA synthetase